MAAVAVDDTREDDAAAAHVGAAERAVLVRVRVALVLEALVRDVVLELREREGLGQQQGRCWGSATISAETFCAQCGRVCGPAVEGNRTTAAGSCSTSVRAACMFS